MIKTLRITSFIAVILAVVFFVGLAISYGTCPAVFGVRGDKQIEQFLNSAGAIEQFKQARGDKVGEQRRGTSPLVRQAEAFALYLNPPPKPTAAPVVAPSEPRPKSVSPKFRLVGTSRHSIHPELSLALIDEPGKGMHWVRPSSKVGHLIIEQIRDGLVVVRDGENTFELVAERPAKRSLLKANTSSGGRITESKPPEINAEVKMSAEDEALMKEAEAEMKKALAELEALQAEEAAQTDFEAGEAAPSALKAEGIPAEVKSDRPIYNPKAMRISAKEARRLGRLGRRLRDVQRPNQGGEDRPESGANVNQPDTNDANVPK